MHVNIRRGLAFFDRSDQGMGRPSIVRYDARTGVLHPVEGARDDDVVCAVSRDGKRLLLRSAEPLTVRGHNRSRLTVLTEGMPPCTTNRMFSHWSVFDPSGQRALVGTLKASALPVVMDTATCDPVVTMTRPVDARFGEVDPIEGRLWSPHIRFKDTVLSVDCATGSTDKVTLPAGSRIERLRFARDGFSILTLGEKGTLSRHGRDGSLMWLTDMSSFGRAGVGHLFLNEAGTHILLSLWESKNSEWGENLVVGMERGHVERTILGHRRPPARLAADWFGDHLLTYAGEIVDFFSGQIVGELSVQAS